MGAKHPNITHIDEIAPREMHKGTRFGFRARRLGPPSGGAALGCSWYEIPPGRTAFPQHFHCANEEAIFILEGHGTARIDDARIAVSAGDYIALPIGPDHAHTLENTGEAPLRYLCFSTMQPTDIVGYPDSGKIAAVGARDLTQGIMGNPDVWVRVLLKNQDSVDYYDGEDTGE